MAAGEYRYGNPRTEEERRRRHAELYGEGDSLPPRGTGRMRGSGSGMAVVWALGLVAYFAMLIESRKR